jgi:hypothetical protein
MTDQPDSRVPSTGEIPVGQRLFDSPFLLLVAGLAVTAVFYTFWGLWEIMTLPQAPLP